MELAALLRKSIRDSGQSLNALAQECGVDSGQLSRFMREERSLTLESVEKLLRYFGLRVQPASDVKPAKKKGKK
jgi:plasmid maintenance system antidote protein VapI